MSSAYNYWPTDYDEIQKQFVAQRLLYIFSAEVKSWQPQI